MLSCNNMIMQAICEGGWPDKNEAEEKDKESASDGEFTSDKAENSMVQSILSKENVRVVSTQF